MNWNLLVTGPAQEQLRRIPERDRERVEAALLAITAILHRTSVTY
jgi:hypothetical protein